MSREKQSQAERVLEYIKEFGHITRIQAFSELGIFELASRINALEKKGHRFRKEKHVGENRFGDSFVYATYYLVEDIENE